MRLMQKINLETRLLSGQKKNLPTTLALTKSVQMIRESDFSFERIIKLYDLELGSVLVVGANDGAEFNDPVYNRFGKVFAIEPDPSLQNELTINLSKLNESIIFPCAVGQNAGHSKVYLASNKGQSSSLLKPGLHLSESPHVTFEDTYEVEVKRIDSLFKEKNCPKIWVVDVQGFELNVFKGAGDLLNHVDFIYCEVNRGDVYEGCVQIDELDNFLNQFDLHRVLFRWFKLWGDAVYIRREIHQRQ